MKKSDFVAEVAKRTNVPRTKADEAVNAMLDIITEALKSGDKVTLTGFGTFEVRERGARPGINIRTKEKITIAASKRPVFNAGAVLKGAVSGKVVAPAPAAESKAPATDSAAPAKKATGGRGKKKTS